MNVKEMQYDFKLKLNKVDSSDHSNLKIPEIDWLLNEGLSVYMKQRYGINNSKGEGFETTQKRIDDLRNLVVKNKPLIATALPIDNSFEAKLPENYLFAVRLQATSSKGSCGHKKCVCVPTQHDDLSDALKNPYYEPSFEWGEVPVVYGTTGDTVADSNKVFGYTDGTFSISEFVLDYLRMPKRIAFPSGTPGQTYNYPDGTAVSVDQDCELPAHTHNEIVDLAVQIAAGNLESPGYQFKVGKVMQNE
jgi:hypothetical protein